MAGKIAAMQHSDVWTSDLLIALLHPVNQSLSAQDGA